MMAAGKMETGVVSRDILKDGSAETLCWIRPRWEVK